MKSNLFNQDVPILLLEESILTCYLYIPTLIDMVLNMKYWRIYVEI